ncbi:MAG: hypothetical protein LBP30_00320 [Clostridiales Family XIII bacterium]|jgi:seryl-tRNA synthetase|nr:hypothetical protein [Clostridiales Family XIII bacterium]
MLDIKYIVENPEDVKRNVADRNMVCDVDRLIALYGDMKTVRQGIEELNAGINKNQKSIGAAKTDEERAAIIANGKKMKEDAAALKEKLDAMSPEYDELMLSVPNTMAEDTPIGKNEELNVVVETFLEPTAFDFKPLDHAEIGKRLELIDFEAGA